MPQVSLELAFPLLIQHWRHLSRVFGTGVLNVNTSILLNLQKHTEDLRRMLWAKVKKSFAEGFRNLGRNNLQQRRKEMCVLNDSSTLVASAGLQKPRKRARFATYQDAGHDVL